MSDRSDDEPSLHMVQLSLDREQTMHVGRGHLRRMREPDLGYLIHCALAATFGDAAPTPYRLEREGDDDVPLRVLAYSSRPAGELEAIGRKAGADAVDLDRLLSKRVPTVEAGTTLCFEVRVCPTVRKASEGEHHRKGAELDAYVDACRAAETAGQEMPERQMVYQTWLRSRIDGRGATVLDSALTDFRVRWQYRQRQGVERKAASRRKPDAILTGRLRVEDGPAFAELLAAGVGRHRAFGFGMLLIRRER